MLKEFLTYIVAHATDALKINHDLVVPVQAFPEKDGGVELVSLEQYAAGRSRFREHFKTYLIKAFVEYFTLHKGETISPVFVDPDAMSASIIFDYGSTANPLHQEHGASVKLRKTPEYVALVEANNRAMLQLDLAEWLEDWEHLITAYTEDGAPLEFREALRAVRKIDITKARKTSSNEGSFKVDRGILESVELNAAESFPAEICFRCAPYYGLGERTFTVRTSLRTDEKHPAILLRIKAFEAAKEEMAIEFCDVLDAAIETPKLIGNQ